MRKIAFFVEGLTEMVFLKKLITEVVNASKFSIKTQKMRGGSRSILKIEVLEDPAHTETTECQILITECGSGTSVKSYILENREGLIRTGYTSLVGLVDLHPMERHELHEFKRGLKYRVPQVPIEIKFIIAIMEIESWFLAELTHYEKIDPAITQDAILINLGTESVDNINVENIAEPANTLNLIYQTAGKTYKKTAASIQRTIEVLDYAKIYFEMPAEIPSLKELIDIINSDVISE